MMKSLTHTSELTKSEKQFIQSAKDGKLEEELFLYTNQIALLRYPISGEFAEQQRAAWVRKINEAISEGKIPRPFYSETVHHGNLVHVYYRISRKDYREYIGVRLMIDPIPTNSLELHWIGAFPHLQPPAAAAPVANEHDVHDSAVIIRARKGKEVKEWYEAMAALAVVLARNGAQNRDVTQKMHYQFADELFKSTDDPPPKGATYKGLKRVIRKVFEDEKFEHLIYWPREKNF